MKVKDLIVNYIKDRFIYILAFLLNSALLTLLAELSTSHQVPGSYFLLISVFIFIIFIFIDFSRYHQFFRGLKKCVKNPNYHIRTSTFQEREVLNTIHQIHRNYTADIENLKEGLREEKRFLAQFIHNIKSPVAVIELLLQELLQSENCSEQELKELEDENKQIQRVLEQILSILRLDEFSSDYIPVEINLNDTLIEIINQKKKQFIYNGLYPELEVVDKNIMILSDSKWNKLMIEQIVSNAIKYSAIGKHNGNKIKFYIERKKDIVILKIKDQGIGIPDFDLNRIYNPFFTGANGRKTKNSTGIGLYICAKIAERLGHELYISSEVGKGTTVEIHYLTKTQG